MKNINSKTEKELAKEELAKIIQSEIKNRYFNNNESIASIGKRYKKDSTYMNEQLTYVIELWKQGKKPYIALENTYIDRVKNYHAELFKYILLEAKKKDKDRLMKEYNCVGVWLDEMA